MMTTVPICPKCHKKHRGYSNLDYLECSNCCKEIGNSKLIYPGLCNNCYKSLQKAADKKKRKNAKPGLIEVNNYSYHSTIKGIKVGDVVLLPPTWVDELNGRYGPQEGTVTCLYSDYEGPTKSILGLVHKTNKKEQ